MLDTAVRAIQWGSAGAMVLLGLMVARDWLRGRRPGNHHLVLAILLIAASSFFGRVAEVTGYRYEAVSDISLLAFVGSGYAFLLFRDSFVPLSRAARSVAAAGCLLMGAAGVAARLAQGADATYTRAQFAVVIVVVVGWSACVLEPCVRLWMASRDKPAVQRNRLRSLSAAYLGIVLVLLLLVIGMSSSRNDTFALVAGATGMALIPLLYASFVPPVWLRRVWLEREQRLLRDAVGELVLYAPDRTTIAERALSWATRLVGGHGGCIAISSNEILATRGMDGDEAHRLVSEVDVSAGPQLLRVAPLGQAVAVPLELGQEHLGALVVLAGPLTPVFGRDEVDVLGSYSLFITTALERVLLLEAVTSQSQERESILASLSDLDVGLAITEHGRGTHVNDGLVRLTGYTRAELLAIDNLIDLCTPEDRPRLEANAEAILAGNPVPHHIETSLITKDGRRLAIEVAGKLLGDPALRRFITVVHDITERKKAEFELAARVGELASIAATDSLTGLANRREFERVLAHPRASGFAILVIDVDHLKAINDAYGHEAGDAHLRAVADALHMGMREGDTVARAGGDEFVALMPGASLEEAAAVAHRLRQTLLGVAVGHGQARISVGCAAGLAHDDGFAVLAAADDAMYRAKQRGRDRVELAVDGAGGTYATTLSRWEPILPSLIAERRLVSAFQPIVDLLTGRIHGYEALARLADGPVDTSVESLFSAAQRLGMHRDLDWVCRRAAVQDAHVLPPDALLFINVGVSALVDPLHDVDQMLLLLRWARRSPGRTVLELTERESVRDLGRLRDVLNEYRRHGFRFALDDVGEGFSTFEVLATSTPEFIKISSKLIRFADRLGPQAVIRSLVTFATTTATQLIAEGIETATDAERMRELGVHLGQGYALGRPALSADPPDDSRTAASS